MASSLTYGAISKRQGQGLDVERVRMHMDKATGEFRGFAHVHFGSEDGLDAAVQLDGTDFMGRELRVTYAKPPS